MIYVSNPLRRSAWAVFLYRGKRVASYILRESKLWDKELSCKIDVQWKPQYAGTVRKC